MSMSFLAAAAIDCSKKIRRGGDLFGSLVNCDGRRTYFLGTVSAEIYNFPFTMLFRLLLV